MNDQEMDKPDTDHDMSDQELDALLETWREPGISPFIVARMDRDLRNRPRLELRRLSPWIAGAMAAGLVLGFVVPMNDAGRTAARHDLSTLVTWVW